MFAEFDAHSYRVSSFVAIWIRIDSKLLQLFKFKISLLFNFANSCCFNCLTDVDKT